MAIPAQDSLRTTEVPYNKIPAALSVAVFVFASFSRRNPCCCAASSDFAQLCGKISAFTHGFASSSAKRHKFLSHLAACLSVCRCFHVTRLKQVLIGRACISRCALWCLVNVNLRPEAERRIPSLQNKQKTFFCFSPTVGLYISTTL